MITKLDGGCADCLSHDGGISFLQARSVRLLLPDRPKLFMPERRLRRLTGAPTSALKIQDAATLRIMLEEFDGMTLSDDQIQAMLLAEFGKTHLLGEAFSHHWPGTRLGQIDWLRVLRPSPAPMKWSFEQPMSRLSIGESAGGKRPADGIYALAPALNSRAPASHVENSTIPGVCEPIAPTGLNCSRKPRRRRTLASDKRVKAFSSLAVAAIFLVLALPPHVLDTPAPARTSAVSSAPRSRDGFAASPPLLAPIAAPRFEHLATLTREPSGARLIALAAAPQAVLPAKEATAAPVQAVRHGVLSDTVEAALVAPPFATESTSVAPTPPRRPAVKRKKTTAASIERKRSDIVTLVMPDILKPQ